MMWSNRVLVVMVHDGIIMGRGNDSNGHGYGYLVLRGLNGK